jgi:hypothetical protein
VERETTAAVNAARWTTRVLGVVCLSVPTGLLNLFAPVGLTALLAYLLVKLWEEVHNDG